MRLELCTASPPGRGLEVGGYARRVYSVDKEARGRPWVVNDGGSHGPGMRTSGLGPQMGAVSSAGDQAAG